MRQGEERAEGLPAAPDTGASAPECLVARYRHASSSLAGGLPVVPG
jgi:hypothetical protein